MHSALVLEPKVSLANDIEKTLVKMGFKVEVCHLLDTAEKIIGQKKFELTVLSSKVQNDTCHDLISFLNRNSFNTKVLLLTGSSVTERIQGLKCGADDCFPKPFDWQEFKLRVLSLSNKRKIFDSKCLPISKYSHFYPTEGILQFRDDSLCLRKKEAEMLQCLLCHRGRVIGKKSIARWVWGDLEANCEAKTVEAYISRLRKKLFKAGVRFDSVKGFGYRLRVVEQVG